MKSDQKLSLKELNKKAHELRKDLVKVTVKNEAGHIAPSLSCMDILTVLYYRIMNISEDPKWDERDRLIFSKAHGCYGIYAIIADLKYIDRKEWENFYKGSSLSSCLERNIDYGIEAGCGALGHGLPIATGIAFGAKLLKKKYRVYCVVGDGEMQEGSNWEAIQFAVKHQLTNLTVIIDHNRLQAMDFIENILITKNRKNDIREKMKAFGCTVRTCDGHSHKNIISIIEKWIDDQNKLVGPQVLIANTIKGFGLLCMENIPKFHFRIPSDEELRLGCRYE